MRFPKPHRLLAAAGHISGAALICLAVGCGDAGSTASGPNGSSSAATATATPDSSTTPEGGFVPADSASPDLSDPTQEETQPVGREIWSENFAESKSKAASEGKDLLIDFTGSDWCQYCIQLNDEVFSHAEFAAYAKDNFVLVELDFPQDQSKLSEDVLKQNAEIQAKYGIEEFPTILLADAQGRPYAKTGYQPGGLLGYIQHLTELKATRVVRDEAIAAAEQLEGIERAKKLDEMLSGIEPPLILPSYEAEVAQIISLDEANEAGLRQRYERRLVAWKFRPRLGEVQQFANESKNADAILLKLEEVEGEFSDYVDGRITLTRIRIQMLNNEGRLDDVIKLADTVLADEEIQGDGRRMILISKLGALEMSNRLEEGIAVVDTIGAEFPGNPSLSTRLLLTKVNYLAKLDRLEESREALKEARKLASSELMPEVDALEKQLFSPEANVGTEDQAPPPAADGEAGSGDESETSDKADSTEDDNAGAKADNPDEAGAAAASDQSGTGSGNNS